MTPKATGIEELQLEADQARGIARLLKKMRLHFAGVPQQFHPKRPPPVSGPVWPGKIH